MQCDQYPLLPSLDFLSGCSFKCCFGLLIICCIAQDLLDKLKGGCMRIKAFSLCHYCYMTTNYLASRWMIFQKTRDVITPLQMELLYDIPHNVPGMTVGCDICPIRNIYSPAKNITQVHKDMILSFMIYLILFIINLNTNKINDRIWGVFDTLPPPPI